LRQELEAVKGTAAELSAAVATLTKQLDEVRRGLGL
jgi:hypothetical protein